MKKRHFLQAVAATTLAAGIAPAFAQAVTPIKFQLDWRFEGPAALFLTPVGKGYFKQAGVDGPGGAGHGPGGGGPPGPPRPPPNGVPDPGPGGGVPPQKPPPPEK